jgi:hypothetical protein
LDHCRECSIAASALERLGYGQLPDQRCTEVSVNRSPLIKWIVPVVAAGALSACATNLSSSLYEPNFGMRQMNWGENVDERLLQNGLYAPKPFGVSAYAISPYASPCLTAEYRCSQQAQSAWSSFDP